MKIKYLWIILYVIRVHLLGSVVCNSFVMNVLGSFHVSSCNEQGAYQDLRSFFENL